MTEQERHLESERLIDEMTREIEAIKEALLANCEIPHPAPSKMTDASQDGPGARTN